MHQTDSKDTEANSPIQSTPSNSTHENRTALQKLIPGVLTESGLNLNALLAHIGEPTLNQSGACGLYWPGKEQSYSEATAPTPATLIPEPQKSKDWDSTENIIIEGDNIDVLKIMQNSYTGKVQLIYIDPPYNTGNDFVYNDKYDVSTQYQQEFPENTNEDGTKTHQNSDSSNRHNNWLSMIYSRLILGRSLLHETGTIFVSIDSNEVSHLKVLMDEVFGTENYLAQFAWVNNLKGRQISGSGPAKTHEYILCYAKDANLAPPFVGKADMLKSLMPTVYKGLDYVVQHDQIGSYVLKNELYNTNSKFNEETRPNLVYPIFFQPDTGEVAVGEQLSDPAPSGFVTIMPHPCNNGTHKFHAWRWSKNKVLQENQNLHFECKNNSWRIWTKVREINKTALKDILLGISTTQGRKDLESLKLSRIFDYPKPVDLIRCFLSCMDTKDGIILDFFAGSGTTAQAVMAQNAIDGGNRKFILVQLPETVDHPAYKTIADITRERVRRAGIKVQKEADPIPKNLDVGFKAYRVGTGTVTS